MRVLVRMVGGILFEVGLGLELELMVLGRGIVVAMAVGGLVVIMCK